MKVSIKVWLCCSSHGRNIKSCRVRSFTQGILTAIGTACVFLFLQLLRAGVPHPSLGAIFLSLFKARIVNIDFLYMYCSTNLLTNSDIFYPIQLKKGSENWKYEGTVNNPLMPKLLVQTLWSYNMILRLVPLYCTYDFAIFQHWQLRNVF